MFRKQLFITLFRLFSAQLCLDSVWNARIFGLICVFTWHFIKIEHIFHSGLWIGLVSMWCSVRLSVLPIMHCEHMPDGFTTGESLVNQCQLKIINIFFYKHNIYCIWLHWNKVKCLDYLSMSRYLHKHQKKKKKKGWASEILWCELKRDLHMHKLKEYKGA